MKATIPIPTTVINHVKEYLLDEFPSITQKQSNSVFKNMIELWFYIKERHTMDVLKLEESEENLKLSGKSYLNFTNIHKKDITTFQVRIGKTILSYKNLLDILIELKLLERNNKYSSGNFSMSYRPHASIVYDNIQLIEINLEKIFKNSKYQKDIIAENPHTYRKLIQDMYLIKIDLEKLYWHLDQSIGLPYSKKTDAPLTPLKSYALKIRALKINLGLHFFSVSSTGRIYSSMANLPSIMIPFISLNNQSVVEIDAANSQPLLLANLVNNPKYQTDCENGLFYEVMGNSMGISRDEFKEKSYKWIFFNDNQIGKVWKDRLEAVYPGLTKQINQIKSEKPLWFELQSLEADIWIKIAQKQLNPVITRHDSLIVESKHATRISKEIEKEYKRRGMKVKLKLASSNNINN